MQPVAVTDHRYHYMETYSDGCSNYCAVYDPDTGYIGCKNRCNDCTVFQRIRGYFYNEMRCINLRFTYLLTYHVFTLL